jgi:hypothetical protein
MSKVTRLIFVVFCLINIAACSNLTKEHPSFTGEKQWDFDHNLQFREIKLAPNHYQIRVFQLGNVPFEKISAFVLRRGLRICQSYNYKVELLKGVEGFNDKQGSPNLILSDLVANIECPST